MRIRSLFFFRRHHLLLLVVAVLLVALVLMSLRAKQKKGIEFVDALWLDLISPVQKGATFLIRTVQGGVRQYFFLVSLEKENALLRQQVAELQQKNHQREEAVLANDRLRKILQFREQVSTSTVGAEVIGRDPTSWFKSVMINKGESDGIRKGMAVVCPEGIIGQVLKTALRSSVVLLITDYNSAVDGIIQRTRGKAIVEGRGENRCQLKYLLRSEEVAVGDVVVTSGLGGNFPKGLAVGEIRKVEKEGHGIFQYAELVPYVDLTRIEEVLVITESVSLPVVEEKEKEKKVMKPSSGSRRKK